MEEKVYVLITHSEDNDVLYPKVFKTKEDMERYIKEGLQDSYESLAQGYIEEELDKEADQIIADLYYKGYSGDSFGVIYIYNEEKIISYNDEE